MWFRNGWVCSERWSRSGLYFFRAQTHSHPEKRHSVSLYRGQWVITGDSAFTFRNYAEESLKTEGKERTIHLETASKLGVCHLLPTPSVTSSHAVIFSHIHLYRGSSLKASKTSLTPTTFRTRHSYRNPGLFLQPSYSRHHSTKSRAVTNSSPQITAYRNKTGSNSICSRSPSSWDSRK